jgi:hypothetical protein
MKNYFGKNLSQREKERPKAFEERRPPAMINERDEKASRRCYKGYFFIFQLKEEVFC